MKKTILKNYADLIARKGVNVQKGQEVIISAELDQPDFVKLLVEACYKAGAGKVRVEWTHQPLTKLHVRYQTQRVLNTLEDWEVEKLRRRAQTLPAMIYLESADPDGQNGINQTKYTKMQQARFPIIKPIRDEMENKYQWCIAAVPGAAWAKKVFPKLSKGKAVEKLWETILYTSRALEDPIAAWEEHNRDLANRCQHLNNLGLTALHYTSKNGTNLHVGLIPQAQFLGGAEETLGSGVVFNPNIPSEEVFTTPMRGQAHGIVYATRPLAYRGELIEDFWIRFEEGKAVEVAAKKNQALLETLIHMDPGAAYLGECALVPYDSPIRKSDILFYNTLFDENAACHLALGMGFANCIRDFDQYSLEECRQMGVNDSMIHEDFMIGSKDLSITGETKDGQIVQIFKDGTWAF